MPNDNFGEWGGVKTGCLNFSKKNRRAPQRGRERERELLRRKNKNDVNVCESICLFDVGMCFEFYDDYHTFIKVNALSLYSFIGF